jgi:hypothetical protein
MLGDQLKPIRIYAWMAGGCVTVEPTFDIFKRQQDGNVVWIDCAGTLRDAIAKAKQAIVLNPVAHVIVNSRTGEKSTVSPDGSVEI